MITIPTDNIILITEEYKLARKRKGGRSVSFELTGVFGSASVQPGFLSSAAVPAFVADGTALTAAGRTTIRVPKSGFPMLKVTGATGTTAILVNTVDFTLL